MKKVLGIIFIILVLALGTILIFHPDSPLRAGEKKILQEREAQVGKVDRNETVLSLEKEVPLGIPIGIVVLIFVLLAILSKQEKRKILDSSEVDQQQKEIDGLKGLVRLIRKISLYFLIGSFAFIIFFWISPWKKLLIFTSIGTWFLFFLFLFIWYFTFAVKFVLQGEKGVVLRFKKYNRTLEPGIGIIFPPLEKIIFVDIREKEVDIPSQDIITDDSAAVKVNAFINYKITEADRYLFAVGDPLNMIKKNAQALIRDKISKMKFDEAKSKMGEISDEFSDTLDEFSKGWGIDVTRVKLEDIDPGEEVKKSLNEVIKSKKEREAMVEKAEGESRAIERLTKAFGGDEKGLKNLLTDRLIREGIGDKSQVWLGLEDVLEKVSKFFPKS